MKTLGPIVLFIVVPWALGCAAKATDEQIDEMCRHSLELRGTLRGTSAEEEKEKIEKKYAFEKKQLEEEMARDLKGLDDVLAQQLADLTRAELTPSKEGEEEMTPEELKEAQISAAKEDIEKKKKAIRDQFEPMIEKLGPKEEREIERQMEYVAKRKEKADEAHEACVAEAEKAGVTEEAARCRLEADRIEHYEACK